MFNILARKMKLNLIAAACGSDLGIGYKGDLPWRLKAEMKHFNRMTTTSGALKNACIMGRKTWDSIPANFRPLKNRLNVVLTRQEPHILLDEVPAERKGDVVVCQSFEESLKVLSQMNGIHLDAVWVIGGHQVYQDALQSDLCHRIYLTEIVNSFECDTFFPRFDKSAFQEVSDPEVPQELQTEGEITYNYKVYEKIHT